jgi:predicted PurR-regulated permease PerM
MTMPTGLFERLDRRLKAIVGVAALVVIATGIRSAASVLDSLLLAALLTIVILPVYHSFRRRGLSNGVSLALTTILLLGIALALLGFLGVAGTQLVSKVPVYQDKLEGLKQNVETMLQTRGIEPDRVLSFDLINPGRLMGLAAALLTGVGKVLSQSLLLILIVAFILVETGARGQSFTPGGQFEAVARNVRQYLIITSATGLAYSVLIYIFMLAMGTDLALVWAVLAFILNFVPNIGMALSLIPPLLLTLLEFGWQRALVLLAGFLFLNFIIDNIVKPRFMQTGLDVSPLVSLVSVMVWSYLLGPTGALLALPLTIALKRLWQDPPGVAPPLPPAIVVVEPQPGSA